MTDTPFPKKNRIGLALSGGGYRAAAFHLGVLRKLYQLKILGKIDVISTISGGSIIGAFYGLHKDDFATFEDALVKNLQKSCIRRIILHWRLLTVVVLIILFAWFLAYDPLNLSFPRWITFIITVGLLISPFFLQFHIVSLTSLKIHAYQKIFFGKAKIEDMPETPVIAINATNLSTGTLWTFSKKKCSDSSYEFPMDGGESIRFDCRKMPLAVAVASSTSVPVPFDPVTIDKTYFINAADFQRVKPRLIDGGLYDNQGIHKITQTNSSYACDTIIVSDGSQPFPKHFRATSTFSILCRGIDVMMRKIKNLQFIRDVYSGNREIAYFSLDWEYRLCVKSFVSSFKRNQLPVEISTSHGLFEDDKKLLNDDLVDRICRSIEFDAITKMGLSEQEIKKISTIKTNLTSLTKSQIDLLSRHGETLCSIQIKLYCPSLKKQNL